MEKNAILLAGPDRAVPLALRIRLLFGDSWNQLGWMFCGLSLVHLRLFIIPALTRWDWYLDGLNMFQWVNFAFLFILSAIGVHYLGVGLRKGFRGLHLLRYGRLATGRLETSAATGRFLDEEPLYKIVFRFRLPDGDTSTAAALTAEPARLKDESEEPLVYDGLDPDVNVMLDDLPGRPRIDEDGTVRARDEGWAWPLLVVPGLTVLLHVVWTVLAR